MTNVSVVLYKTPLEQLERLLQCLYASERINKIYIIDNSPKRLPETSIFKDIRVEYIFNGRNLGYGKAHNIALRESCKDNIQYHLVVNSDIYFENGTIEKLEDYMSANTDVALLSPRVLYPDGRLQYLCKLLPRPSDLLLRRFLPEKMYKNRRATFELRQSGYNKIMNIPYLSGCFMLLRTEHVREIGFFDERFFMYPEDIDLTRRLHSRHQTLFFPDVQIVHDHQQASYHSLRMLLIHIVNLCRYFNKWGWIYDPERDETNSAVLRSVSKVL